MSQKFVIGEEYTDKANPNKPEDQFSRWIRGPLKTGIGMMGGIRRLKSHSPPNEDECTAVILVSNKKRRPSGLDNPWEDRIDLENGEIKYWGDAKKNPEKDFRNYKGNSLLMNIYEQSTIKNEREKTPPILFFQKPRVGVVRFCGLVVIENVEIKRFLHEKVPVPNYLFHLSILNEDKIELDWIHERTKSGNDDKSPEAWEDWVESGHVDKYSIWKRSVRKKSEQLPDSREDIKLLNKLRKVFSSREFEFLAKYVLMENADFNDLKVTPSTGDEGFDLIGDLFVSNLDLKIKILVEVKNWKIDSSVGVKEVSRLASRIEKGQQGIFISSSYFSKPAQVETNKTHPIKLISSSEFLNLVKNTNLIKKNRDLDDKIVKKIKEEKI